VQSSNKSSNNFEQSGMSHSLKTHSKFHHTASNDGGLEEIVEIDDIHIGEQEYTGPMDL